MRSIRPISADEKVVYLHIPKTAGTSINFYLRSIVGSDKVGWLGKEISLEDLSNQEKIEPFKVIGGHFNIEQAREIQFPVVYVSTLREPISRALSYYRYIMKIPSEVERLGLCGNFDEDVMHRFGEIVRDQQCAFFGIQMAEDPLRALLEIENTYVAPVERAQNLVDQLSAALGVTAAPLGRQNRGEGPTPDLSSEIYEVLRTVLVRDRALYDGLVHGKYFG
ncbi:sulfotransferase family 2 domain-containing protein [Aurantimonas endophytica]|uniref:Sulfotransferase family protein n=1 Tax=Aurantimonas endophytica TaxID=1522175 RepID=A0A7W6HDI9_9HYPH|nr:sulfotransferase family 2 domain-containing protein [Aurantimonas endophytica]MBB4003061.1 hypothetical protein [Aurantimonas endophytica]MCO6403932.1 sulfotransferase family 2 domain-containing protein [Aurantimonas endophytica]